MNKRLIPSYQTTFFTESGNRMIVTSDFDPSEDNIIVKAEELAEQWDIPENSILIQIEKCFTISTKEKDLKMYIGVIDGNKDRIFIEKPGNLYYCKQYPRLTVTQTQILNDLSAGFIKPYYA